MRPLFRDRLTISAATALGTLLAILIVQIMFPAAALPASPVKAAGWQLENVDPPSYAVIDPARTNLNVDSVVLACGELHGRRGLQLELYLSSAGPLLPRGAAPEQLNKVSRVEVVVDTEIFAADILFADDFLVVVDQYTEISTMVSDRLLDAMQRGRSMTIRFALLDDTDRDGGFDGELHLDLQAGRGGAAVAAVRRCVTGELWSRRR